MLILLIPIRSVEHGIEKAETVLARRGFLLACLVGSVAYEGDDTDAGEVDGEEVDFGDGEGASKFGEEGGVQAVEAVRLGRAVFGVSMSL